MGRQVTKLNKNRIKLIFFFLVLLMILLAFRLAWIQIVRAEEYTDKAIDQQMKDMPVEAARGDILDCNGEKLATSVRCYSIWVRPELMRQNYTAEEIEDYSQRLSVILDKDFESVKGVITSTDSLRRVARYLNKEQIDTIKRMDLKGIEIVASTRRHYPLETNGAQMLGSVTDDNIGRTGIEAQFDNYLSGVSGRWIKDTDLNGDTLAYGSQRYFKAKDGLNVRLTINSVLQNYAEQALKKQMEKAKCDRMMCLVMDPKTGDILAMVTTPSFDPNDASQPVTKKEKEKFEKMNADQQSEYLSRLWTNPIVSDLYEPGSTFKLITTSSALEEGVTNLADRFECVGSVPVGGIRLNCTATHGKQSLVEAVGNSCNPVQVALGQRLGKDRFYNYLEMFGITDPTHVDLPAETSAMVQDKDSVGDVELATMCFGQGIALTPIQMLTAACAIGNDGVLMQPRIVTEMTDKNGKVVKKFKTKAVRKVFSTKTADEMKEIMEYVVNEGGGTRAQIPGYRIGGKTGTANKAKNGHYTSKTDCSFIGMAPMEDPKFAILVIGDNPKKMHFGATVAAPVARRFLEKALAYYEIGPQYSKEEKEQNNVGPTYVPDVTDQDSSSAKAEIRSAGLKPKVSPDTGDKKAFTVVDQYPKAGTKVFKGGTVYIYKE
ncbi:penicillin-binding transpeptidase domain-containing protein [Eubacterium sp. AB3007]|uniref:penicillin-binding transpeptidase domain-containing protein n=1 Tax=Eubacterium sp. AB3007 TaxID=1392487 RepID=UPI00068D1140|nr:penicillin-binding transpeptidase domain-containing protein [Eubacterium sp. AB3007]